jgi:16S rRNA (guanine1207-N2)-methyltransferase
VNPALETLLLAFSQDGGLAVPERCLFLGAQPHPAMQGWPHLTGWQPIKPLADAWDNAGFQRVDVPGEERWPLVLVLPGKSREETLAGFAMARDHLLPRGRIICSMPNTMGAARFEKEFAKATGTLSSIQKNKCRAFHALDDGSWNEGLFDEWRKLGEPCRIPDTPFITRAGVFSHGRIDPGSLFLSEHLPPSLYGSAADLGAGWGFLTESLLARCPAIATVDLYESDARALDCARTNLAHHASKVRHHWHDVTAGLPESYDIIVMNPPFHTGQAADLDLGRAFIASAATALRRGGRLFMVANRQLPYEAALDAQQLSWRKPVENPTFKLLFAQKTR